EGRKAGSGRVPLMLGFLVLHLVGVLGWGATQLYLPSLIASCQREEATPTKPPGQWSMAHFLFTHVSTPAALLAIVAGTVVFLLDRNVEAWLLLKLGLVAMLTLAHLGNGMLLLRARHHPGKP